MTADDANEMGDSVECWTAGIGNQNARDKKAPSAEGGESTPVKENEWDALTTRRLGGANETKRKQGTKACAMHRAVIGVCRKCVYTFDPVPLLGCAAV